ncbi:MAG: hypothetical protein ACE5JR_02600 [Gemmatimonadota bacterium]
MPAGRTGRTRALLAAALALVVFAVTMWARAPVGAGVYYDDGVYLALGRSLAEGEGYRYANLPGSVPGVKYPPLFPVVLAAGWKLFGPYPGSLPALKAVNAALWGGAAAATFLLFAVGGGRRLVAMTAVTVFGFLSVPALSIATVLLSEPLFLLLAASALLASLRAHKGRPAIAGGEAPGEAGLPAATLAAGALAAAAFLTRSIGIAAAAAVACAALAAGAGHRPAGGRLRGVALALLFPALAAVGWFAWTAAAGGGVPRIAAGQYGAYAGWYLDGIGDDLAGRIRLIAGSAWPVFLSTLEVVWIPEAPPWAGRVVVLLLGALAVLGGRSAFRRNPALPLFVLFYLALVAVWPYEPDRFFWTIHPFLTLLAAEGVAEAIPTLRADLPRLGVPAAAVGLTFIAINTARYELRGYARRAWELPQQAPAAAFAPLVAWIRENTPAEAIVASRLDPFVYWETGRLAVPSWQFLPTDYGRYERDPATLAAGLEAIREAFRPDYVAVLRGDNKPYLTAAAYAEAYPDRIELAYGGAGEGEPGVVYRLLSPPNPP